MSHIALYRAWRPQLFRDIVGQSHITRTLQNALKEGRFSHAYLFSGPRGTGKTSAAKILAKAVNCEHGSANGEPCNECSACVRITEGAVMDVVEIDAASNRGVEEIRDIRDKVKYAPTEVKYKVYIIDEVHMLTTEAFNALLKTLEEPPKHVLFVLATTEPNRIPPTIISRCQRFDFRRVSLQDQTDRIAFICEQEKIETEPEALQFIARLSDGGMRDALSLLDQIISFGESKVTYEQVVEMTGGLASEQFGALAEAVHLKDAGKVLQLLETWMAEGKHIEHAMESLIQYFRDLLLIQMVPNASSMTERVLDVEHFQNISNQFSRDELFQFIEILGRYNAELKYASHPQTIFEIALLKLCSLEMTANAGATQGAQGMMGGSAEAGTEHAATVQQLMAKVTALEKQIQTLQRTIAEGRPAASGAGSSSGGKSAAESAAGQVSAGSNAGMKQPRKVPAAVSTGSGGISAVRLKEYRNQHDAASFKSVLGKWHQVLQTVKERKITVHAWLVDGEPAACSDEGILIAFKNTIHRETTQKPANQQLIEEVIHEVLGKPMKIDTVMLKEWKALTDADEEEQSEELQWAVDGEQAEQGTSDQPEWVEEALRLFGEDIVEVKDGTE